MQQSIMNIDKMRVYSLTRYSWQRRKLNNIGQELLSGEYDMSPFSRRQLATAEPINYLSVGADTLDCIFYPERAVLRHIEGENLRQFLKGELSDKDEKLVGLVRREYKFPISRGYVIRIGESLAVGGAGIALSYLLSKVL